MANTLRKMRKEVKKRNKMILPQEMYTNLIGSFLISLKILRVYDGTDKELKDFYLKIKKEYKKRDDIDGGTLLKTVAKDLGVKIPYGDIALVVSDYNMLIAPYIDLGTGKKILPLRVDGFMSQTLLSGKIYPLVGKKVLDVEEMIKDE